MIGVGTRLQYMNFTWAWERTRRWWNTETQCFQDWRSDENPRRPASNLFCGTVSLTHCWSFLLFRLSKLSLHGVLAALPENSYSLDRPTCSMSPKIYSSGRHDRQPPLVADFRSQFKWHLTCSIRSNPNTLFSPLSDRNCTLMLHTCEQIFWITQ